MRSWNGRPIARKVTVQYLYSFLQINEHGWVHSLLLVYWYMAPKWELQSAHLNVNELRQLRNLYFGRNRTTTSNVVSILSFNTSICTYHWLLRDRAFLSRPEELTMLCIHVATDYQTNRTLHHHLHHLLYFWEIMRHKNRYWNLKKYRLYVTHLQGWWPTRYTHVVNISPCIILLVPQWSNYILSSSYITYSDRPLKGGVMQSNAASFDEENTSEQRCFLSLISKYHWPKIFLKNQSLWLGSAQSRK